jgi:tetratricopeptide (TPR) repeat protein
MKLLIVLLICLATISCRQANTISSQKDPAIGNKRPDPLALALVPHSGTNRIDQGIIRLQKQIRAGKNLDMSIERLGWAFVAKARESFDPGYYKLAEQCALALEVAHPGNLEAMLLRGHVLHNLHRFKEAEPLARSLVAQRGLPFDFGLLSDVLMEQGKLDEAAVACQKMIDLRPDLHSYARGAHIRWLKGNVTGARDLMAMAASAASPRDPESAAWINTRLAGYQFQCGQLDEAELTCAAALDFQKEYPPALLLRGRLLLAQGRMAEAAEVLHRAVELNPLPEYQWTLAEALQGAGDHEQAATVEAQLRKNGAAADPRTFALFLATRHQSVDSALRLAQAELSSRADVFTQDALAWALLAAGKRDEARQHMATALSEGTRDARLFFHAAVVAHESGENEQVKQWAAQASDLKQTLLPSERQQLEVVTRAAGLNLSTQAAALASPIFHSLIH